MAWHSEQERLGLANGGQPSDDEEDEVEEGAAGGSSGGAPALTALPAQASTQDLQRQVAAQSRELAGLQAQLQLLVAHLGAGGGAQAGHVAAGPAAAGAVAVAAPAAAGAASGADPRFDLLNGMLWQPEAAAAATAGAAGGALPAALAGGLGGISGSGPAGGAGSSRPFIPDPSQVTNATAATIPGLNAAASQLMAAHSHLNIPSALPIPISGFGPPMGGLGAPAPGAPHYECELDARVGELLGAAHAPSTNIKVRQAVHYFVRFCCLHGWEDKVLAGDELTFMRYVAWLSRTCKHDTISGYLHGIPVWYQQLGLGHPFQDMPVLSMLRRGVRRRTGSSVRKKRPITPAMLLRWAAMLQPYTADPPRVAVFACMLVAFFGFFRKATVAVATASLSDPGHHLGCANVAVDRRNYCLLIDVPRSKTNQFGDRRDRVCIAGVRGSPIDPVWWYERMLQLSPAPPTAAAFRYARGGNYCPVTHKLLVGTTKSYAKSIGLDPTEVAGHSIRRGGATFAFHVGVPDLLIKLQGIWASTAHQGYIELPLPARLEATQRMQRAIAAGVLGESLGPDVPQWIFGG